MNNWFEIEKTGLAKILERKGKDFAIFELVQNAFDEDSTKVTIDLTYEGYNKARLVVTDDSPDGFKDLSHSWVLFAESYKKQNPEKRGRFNFGEKLVLAISYEAEILTTTGGVRFDSKGRHSLKTKTEKGSVVSCLLRMTKEEFDSVCQSINKLICPPTIETYFNGTRLLTRPVAKSFKATLPTEIGDAEGFIKRSIRETTVNLYEAGANKKAFLYEMGIPVVEIDNEWHVDVGQKVPLTLDRENVSPAYIDKLYTIVYNEMHNQVREVNNTWVNTATSSKDCKPEAVRAFMDAKFGEQRVSFDLSDLEANHDAVGHNYTLIHGKMLSAEQWENARQAGAVQPAGQLFPSRPDSSIPWEPAEVTPKMVAVKEYSIRLGELLLGCKIRVEFCKQKSYEGACYGNRTLQFNVTNLGVAWFDLEKNQEGIDDLILHEYGHEFSSNHLSEDYYKALTKLGAKMVRLAREGKV